MTRSPVRVPIAVTMMLILPLISLSALAATKNESPRAEAAAPIADPAASRDDGPAYIAERAIVRDVSTGALRKPTREETAELVRSLKELTRRPSNLQVTTAADGTEKLDLNGGYKMVIIARPTPEGGTETLCVSTFDEAASFLGLRPEGESNAKAKPAEEGQR